MPHTHIDRSRIEGTIAGIRAVEDSIRATRKYTKAAFRRSAQHPVQGEEFPSRVLTEYYEVYPKTEISWDMPANTAMDWLWGEVPVVPVLFRYDYRCNRASVVVRGGAKSYKLLKEGIPGFLEALANAKTGRTVCVEGIAQSITAQSITPNEVAKAVKA